jgi:hypothetical protein
VREDAALEWRWRQANAHGREARVEASAQNGRCGEQMLIEEAANCMHETEEGGQAIECASSLCSGAAEQNWPVIKGFEGFAPVIENADQGFIPVRKPQWKALIDSHKACDWAEKTKRRFRFLRRKPPTHARSESKGI